MPSRKGHSLQDRFRRRRSASKSRLRCFRTDRSKDRLLRKIRELETASRVDEWLSSPGLGRRSKFLALAPLYKHSLMATSQSGLSCKRGQNGPAISARRADV
jgi:hypothetical protein